MIVEILYYCAYLTYVPLGKGGMDILLTYCKDEIFLLFDRTILMLELKVVTHPSSRIVQVGRRA